MPAACGGYIGYREDRVTREDKQRFTLRISQANATELVVILYEMLLVYIEEAKEAIEAGDGEEVHGAARRARGCLNELLGSLHREYEPAPALSRLYLFCIRRLAVGEAKKDRVPLEEIERVINPLRDAYAQVAAQNNAGPVMGNSQTVYAGLTYGRNTLTENMADQGANRGMYV